MTRKRRTEEQCSGCGDVSDADDYHPCGYCGDPFCLSCFEDTEDEGPLCFRCIKEKSEGEKAS